ncbi:MAG: SpoIIE family protein phosphatase [Nitrospirae bacterium]|nr:SpoIIE family protein phosphatase [Nitrospirota bacterium]MBI3593722.1 SpoIIE family protein phosphatase [Nitrospirota bacterium]
MSGFRHIDWGVAFKAMDGQCESGDRHLVSLFDEGALAAVVDGLGHGREAAESAEAAVKTLGNHPDEPLASLINRCHRNLLRMRGVAMTMVSFQGLGKQEQKRTKIEWLAVGNVEGLLIHTNQNANPRTEWILLNAGTVGYKLPILRTTSVSISPGDQLILATDGIKDTFAEELPQNIPPQQLASQILARHRNPMDDALVLIIRYMEQSI